MIEFWEAINWEIATAVGTIVAAFAAAFSAVILRKQHERDIDWRIRERTLSYSLTHKDKVNEATNNLKTAVNLKTALKLSNDMKQKQDSDGFINKPLKISRKTLESFLGNETEIYVTYNKKSKTDVSFLANHYGLLATEFNNDLLDKPLAKNLYFFQFMRFGFIFRENLTDEEHAKTYSNFNKLYEKWKKEFLE